MNSPAVALEWQVDASPFRNPAIWRQMALVFGVPILLLGLLIAIVTEHDRWLTALRVIGIGAAAVLGLLLVAMVLFKLLGYQQHIQLDETGVRSQVSGRAPVFMKTARARSLLSGQTSVAASGMAVRTNYAIRWGQVWKVDVDEQKYELFLYPPSGPPLLLACTAENFATVREIVQAKTGA